MISWFKDFSPKGFLISFSVAVLTGLIASVAAEGFSEMVKWANDSLLISPAKREAFAAAEEGNRQWLIWATLLVPTLGGLVVGGLVLLIPGKRPHGLPDAIQAGQTGGGEVPTRTGILTALTCMTSLSFGASVGMYGPLVHMGATIGSLVSRFTAEHRRLGVIALGCGVSAAISTAFNAPIAGVIFAHEVVLRHYSIRAFAPVTVSAYVSQIMATEVFEQPRLLEISDVFTVGNPLEYGAFMLVGVIGAFVSIAYMRGILFSGKMAGKLKMPGWLKPAAAGLVLGLVGLAVPELLGVGLDTTKAALNIEQAAGPDGGNILSGLTTLSNALDAENQDFVLKALGLMAVLFIGKTVMTGFCLGMGYAGGVFSPALFIGSLFGVFFGMGLKAMVPWDLNLSFYAICGMGAVTSAVIGAPISTILVVLELTMNYELTKAVVISVVFSNIICSRLFGRSLFDVQLLARGFDLSLGKDKVVLQQKTIANYISDDYVKLSIQATGYEARDKLLAVAQTEAYVVSKEDEFLGQLTLQKIVAWERDGNSLDAAVGELSQHEEVTLTDMTSIFEAMKKVESFVGESIPVVSAKDQLKLIGVIPEGNIFKAYSDAIEEIRQEEYGDH